MRALILAAGAALTLSACGGGGGEAQDNNAMAVDNLQVDNVVINETGATTMEGVTTNDADAALDAAGNNAVAADLMTNTPDTNTANGL